MNNDDLDYLIHFGYAPGWYMARCKSCQKTMDFVDKRAINCRPCAEELYQNRMKQNSTPSETMTLNGWRPIDTAPKETEVFIGRYIDGEFLWGRSEMFYEQGSVFEGETFSGWVWSEDHVRDSVAHDPTHWMPLPKPPNRDVSLDEIYAIDSRCGDC